MPDKQQLVKVDSLVENKRCINYRTLSREISNRNKCRIWIISQIATLN